MRIFITGATGFIGNHVVNKLAGRGHELICLARKSNHVTETLNALGARIVIGDITDKNSVLKGMQGCDQLIHLAALYSMWERNNKAYYDVNVTGARNVMECALETKVSKVIHISSVVTFGKPKELPFNEESEPGKKVFSVYARTKNEADHIVMNMHKKDGLPVVIIYPAAVLGAGDPKPTGKYISDLINKRVPAKVVESSIFTWVSVRDVAEAIIKALEKPGNIGEKYIIGGCRLTFGEFNRLISEISGVGLPFINMPDFLAVINSYILTGISRITGVSPLWGMSVDQIRTMKLGFSADGSKAEKELGICYTTIHKVLEEQIAAERQTVHTKLQPT